ncbi:MAG TPA: phosphotransferase [Dermatophilaceae bacterium]|nr:phosphotransferase [Dermatophilaceae bacterium]
MTRTCWRAAPCCGATTRRWSPPRSRKTRARFAEVYAGARPVVLHADLHGENLKWHGGRLAVFDFDDCGLGVPALDLAIATFYLRDGRPEVEQALLAGYARTGGTEPAPRLGVTPAQFEAMVAARQLLLANCLLTSSTADLRGEAEGYLAVTAERLRRYLRTGRFALSPPAS